VFVFCKCYLTNHGAKDGVQMATPIGITRQRSILYTLASFGSYYSPKLLIHTYVQTFKSKTLSIYVGGANTTNLG
jgi:predicted solute-binding protein